MDIVIISGTYRSGTTLIQKIFDSHKDLSIMNQGLYLYFKQLDTLYIKQIKNNDNDRPIGTSKYYETDKEYKYIFEKINYGTDDIKVLLDNVKSLIDNENNSGKNSPTYEFLDILTKNLKPDIAKNIFNLIINSIKEYKKDLDAQYIGFKELNVEQFIEPLIYSFGKKIKVLELIRDPRSILLSRNTGKYLEDNSVGTHHPILLVSELWNTLVSYNQYLKKNYPNNIYTIKYEEFVKEPKQNICKICDFFGIDFFDNLMDTSRFKNENGTPWKANSSHSQQSGFSTKSLDKWKDSLSKEELGTIEYLCGYFMRLVNYEICNTKKEQFNYFVNYDESNKNFRPWVKEFDLDLNYINKQKIISKKYINDQY